MPNQGFSSGPGFERKRWSSQGGTLQLDTRRLTMQPLGWDDEEELTALYADPLVGVHLPPLGADGIPQMINGSIRSWEERGFGPASVRLRRNGRFIGKSGLNYISRYDEIEVKWVFKPQYWGHGFASEAGSAWIAWGLANTGFHYVVARIVPENTPSVRVAERLKMKPLRQIWDAALYVAMYTTTTSDAPVAGRLPVHAETH